MVDIKEKPAEALAEWTPEQKERLLAALVAEMLPNEAHALPVIGPEKHPIAYLFPAYDAESELSADYTLAYFLELQRRASTPDDAVPWSVMRFRVAKALGLESPKS